MLTTYRRVLTLPGALAFSVAGLIGRMPISMISLGIVLLVSTRTGSYGLAGAVSATYMLAQALVAVVQGRLTDRFGQARVLVVGGTGFAVSLALMMVAVEQGWPVPLPHLFAGLAGATIPLVGSCVRARWARIVPDKRALQTAFAYEAVMDEVVFMLGPTVVTVLATQVHPLAGLAAAVASGLSGMLWLASQRRTEPPPHPKTPDRSARPRMPWGSLGPLTVSSAAIGSLFGSVEVATVAFAESMEAKSATGLLLAILALGSLLSGLITGAIIWHADVATRFRAGAGLLALSMLPLPFVGALPLMGVLLFAAGFAISPTMIALTAWIEQDVPVSRLNEGMSIVQTGMAAGIAPGAAIAGMVIDRVGASPSYWVPAVSGALGVLAGLAARRTVTTPAGPAPEPPLPASPEPPSPTGSSG